MREQRNFPRMPFPCRIELLYCGRSYPGQIENLSMNGALVQLDDDLSVPVGHLCVLCLDLVGDGETMAPLHLGAEAIHGAPNLVGIRFVACDDEIRRRLLLLMERLQSEPDRLEHDLDRIQGYLCDYRNSL